MNPRIKKNFEKILLTLLLCFTFILAVKQFVPFDSLDELEILNWIKGLDRDAFPAHKYPPLFLYLNYILSIAYGKILSFLGFIDNGSRFIMSDFGFRFTLEAGRVVSALCGTAAVFFTYKTGREFYNKHVGFLAAMLVGVNYLFILFSHIFKPEICLTMLLTVTLYFVLKYNHTAKAVYILYGSFFYGLAVAAKFNAFPPALVIIAAILLTAGLKKQNLLKPIIFFPLGTAVGFFCGAPNWLLHPLANLEQILKQYSPESGNLFKQFESQSIPEILSGFFSDFIVYFGLIVFLLFLAAMVLAFIPGRKTGTAAADRLTGKNTGNKKEILLTLYIISYIVLFSFFGYYADRFGLPLYPAVALLAAKVVFVDLKNLLTRLINVRVIRSYTVLLLWLPALGYGVSNAAAAIKTFNLLKTESEWMRTIEYREQHNFDSNNYNIGRQTFTPRVKGRNIKITKHFRLKFPGKYSGKGLHFIQAHLPTYRGFIKGERAKDETAVNLDDFLPFYRVEKRRYQPWDSQCVFLYRPSPALSAIKPGQKNVPVPRVFYRDRHTAFLPLQVYEKNPNSGKTVNGIFRRRLYSRKPISRIKIHIFSLEKKYSLKITAGGVREVVEQKKGTFIQCVELQGLKRESFYHDYVYRLEMESSRQGTRRNTFYFVWEPVYNEDKQPGIPGLNLPADGGEEEIPPLFSNLEPPRGVKAFYGETGIDLSLLNFVGAHTLFVNGEMSSDDIDLDFIPLEKGNYRLSLAGEKIMEQYPRGGGAYLEYCRYSGGKVETKRVGLADQPVSMVNIKVDAPLSFVKIRLKNLRENNYLINQITVTPDYYGYFFSKQAGSNRAKE